MQIQILLLQKGQQLADPYSGMHGPLLVAEFSGHTHVAIVAAFFSPVQSTLQNASLDLMKVISQVSMFCLAAKKQRSFSLNTNSIMGKIN